jgi:hypothetical protein
MDNIIIYYINYNIIDNFFFFFFNKVTDATMHKSEEALGQIQ